MPRRSERDPAAMKLLVDRLLERSSQFAAKLQGVKAKLDAGAAMPEVREEFDQAIRGLREGLQMLPGGPGSQRDPGRRGGGPDDDLMDGLHGPDGPDRPDGPRGQGGLGGPGRRDLPGRRDGVSGPDDRSDGRPDGRPTGRPGGLPPPKQLTADERAGLLIALREIAPAAAEEIEIIRAKNPQSAERLLERLGGQLHPLENHKDRKSTDFAEKKADLDAFVDVVRQGRLLAEERSGHNRPDTITELRGKLRAAIGKQVDARLKIQERQVEDLTRRSARLREQVDKNRANREKFIEERMNESGPVSADGEGGRPRRGGK